MRVECQADFRVGGSFTTKMHIGGHANCDCTFTGTFEEIVEPERISYQVDLGGPVPAKSRVSIEFFPEGRQQTRMVLTQEGLPAEIIQFVQQGTLESFDKLDALLASKEAAA